MKQPMDLSASPPVSPWAVVLAVCVVGSLSTCVTEAAPLILQLDTTSLMGHRLVVSIEPLLKGITTSPTEAKTNAVILPNTTADAINGSIIYFESNSVVTPVTPDGPEMLSADDIDGEHPPTSTPTAAVTEELQMAAEARPEPLSRSRQLSSHEQFISTYTYINSNQTDEENTNNAIDRGEVPIGIRTLIRDQENVDKFVITFPNRCPDGWILEHGHCRHPFKTRIKLANNIPSLRMDQEDVSNLIITFPNRCPNGLKFEYGQCRRPFKSIAKPRGKFKPKRKIKMMT